MSLIDVALKDLMYEEFYTWEEGDKRSTEISYFELGFSVEPSEKELEDSLVNHKLDYVESLEVVEDEMIKVTFCEKDLKDALLNRLDNWKERSDLKQFGRYESCGWI